MKFIADFHIHSKFSRATSKDMDLENLNRWAKIKGIKVLGTGDFTHPLWLKELKTKLEPAELGVYKLKSEDTTRFILTSEISCIYSKNNRTYKVHMLIFAPSFEIVEKINTHLGWIGNLKADGRPILGLDAKELLKIALNISQDCLVVPAHAWTPHFAVFGSMSGFNSLAECFEDYEKYIYAIETGLSSNPAMNWRVSALDKLTLISNSDAHSPAKLGREANVFDIDLSYNSIIGAIKAKDSEKFLMTIEFFPEEGKYHFDGHRNCKISFSPEETEKHKGICPKCGRPLTIGVLNRVDQLADRNSDTQLPKAIPYKSLIPLQEIIADTLGMGVVSQAVQKIYKNLINHFNNEFRILLELSKGEIERVSSPEIAEGVFRVREGKVKVHPGYDGEYGKVEIFSEKERDNFSKQESLF